uniref:RING-type domain-containing protein n=1 Tax=Alexandrium monilatum TaxID=311494 RepID=A0A7S4Q799_9DINO
MQPASSVAFLEQRRSVREQRHAQQTLAEGRSAAPLPEHDPCRHCGARHQWHPDLFCFSPLDVDAAFVKAAAVGDIAKVQALLGGQTLGDVEGPGSSKRALGQRLDPKTKGRQRQRLTHVDVRARPRFHRTPTALHRACAHGHAEVTAALLAAGASPKSRSARFASPLHTCATAECAALLLQAGARVGERDYSQKSAVAAARDGTYCRNPEERSRLVALLRDWQAEHETATALPVITPPRENRIYVGMSAAEIGDVVRRGVLNAWPPTPGSSGSGGQTSVPPTPQGAGAPAGLSGEEEEEQDTQEEGEGIDECAICLADLAGEGPRLVRLRCGHVFHEACVVPALRSCCRCPYCRQDVRGPTVQRAVPEASPV